jgi:hypothetical protein
MRGRQVSLDYWRKVSDILHLLYHRFKLTCGQHLLQQLPGSRMSCRHNGTQFGVVRPVRGRQVQVIHWFRSVYGLWNQYFFDSPGNIMLLLPGQLRRTSL